MASLRCLTCEGHGRIVRGYDGRMIRCPTCLGTGRYEGPLRRRRRSSGRGRDSQALPGEVLERQLGVNAEAGPGATGGLRRPGSSRGRRLLSFPIPKLLLVSWDWVLAAVWFLAGALSDVVVLVPGADNLGQVRRQVLSWLRIALVWLGLLAVAIGVGIVTGFIESGDLPWGFQLPGWFRRWWDLFIP